MNLGHLKSRDSGSQSAAQGQDGWMLEKGGDSQRGAVVALVEGVEVKLGPGK